ncbi:hypothetical protein E4U56_004821 [Claviceps arundinis]|uniref:Uncharacterized protein n=1 Tax=Claviceps arundinis TaxID=1623583 RepID=A0A9P7MXH7_9HYPO|nr:hypothetical protein E4U56_004821 [Claviceps arundinis]
MRVFVALAFACGALAAAVQPLEAAAEAHGALSAESDLQDAIFDIDAAPKMAGPEARPEDLEEASVLDKRAKFKQFSKTIRLPQRRMGEVKPPRIYLNEVRLDFIMAQKRVKTRHGMVTQWYCQSLRFTNGGKVRRRVTARVHRMPPLMQELLPPRTSKVIQLPQNVMEIIMDVIAVPGNGRGPAVSKSRVC